MRTYKFQVIQWVEVMLDETKFTPEFMEEYNASISPRTDVDDHARHIAWLAATDRLDDFTEGYGPIKDFAIETDVFDTEVEPV